MSCQKLESLLLEIIKFTVWIDGYMYGWLHLANWSAYEAGNGRF